MQTIMLSIVTATFRDLIGLRRTLESVSDLLDVADGAAEMIVCDGGTAGVREVLRDFSHLPVVLSSRPDRGVYDAMNRGLRLTSGEYVWFLNGGDTALSTDWGTFRADFARADGAGILYGYVREGLREGRYRRPRAISYLWHALPTSHQAIFYPGEVARRYEYDLAYSVSADYAYTASLSREPGVRWVPVDRAVAKFQLGGLSTSKASQVAKDASHVQRVILGSGRLLRAVSRARHVVSRLATRALHG